MALSTDIAAQTYNGTGSTTTGYPIPFKFWDASEVRVAIFTPEGSRITLGRPAYIVDEVVGEVRTRTAYASTHQVTIYRQVPYTQPTVYPEGGRFLAQTHESALDRVVAQVQQLARDLLRTVRAPVDAPAQPPVEPVANSLVGYDADGAFQYFDATRVRELALLAGDGANAVATWADDVAQPSTVPSFIGQLGVRRSDKSLWVALSTTGGDWVPAGVPFNSVSNEDELYAAMAVSRVVRIKGVIALTGGLVIETDDMVLDGDGPDAGLLLPHDGATQQTVCWVKSKRVKLRNLSVSTGHPLTSGRAYQDIGVRLAVDTGEDCSGLEIVGCRFKNLGWGILRDGTSASEPAMDVRITGCLFEGIYQGAIYLRWFCHNLRIIDNVFRQRTASQTHDIEYNAIYVANVCNDVIVAFNSIRRFGRHAIEIWNGSEPAAAASNVNVLVAHNDIREPLPWSTYTPIGISILGKGWLRQIGNSVDGVVIGLEVPGDPDNDGYHIVTDNGVSNSKSQALSVNGVNHAMIANNVVNRVAVDGFSGIPADTFGAQIINGGRNIRLHNNSFEDAGRFGVFLNGKSLTITGITQAVDAVFTVTSIANATQPNGWFPGKRICIRGLAGAAGSMADLNDKYYTITEVAGNTFKVGVDTSGKTAYVSGGRVQEDYIGLSICGNRFHVNQVLDAAWSGPGSFARSIYAYDFQQAVVQDNVRFVNNTLTGYWGSYSIINYGVVYQDYTGGTVSTTGAEVVIAGSNQSIPVFP